MLDALSRIAGAVRSQLGESLTTVETHRTPLQEATTTSLEALKAYTAGMKFLMSTGDPSTAVPLFKRAVEIDPTFAVAHASLGFAYGLVGEPALAAQSTRRAYELRDRVSDREKFLIVADYELQVTGNLEKARETCELWARTYPRDMMPYGNLGAFIYPTFGQFDKGVEVASRMVEIDPEFPVGYLQLGFNQQFSGRLKDAEATFNRAAERKLDLPEISVQRYDLAFLRGDTAGMTHEHALALGKPNWEDEIAAREGFVLAYSGQLHEANMRSRHAADLAMQTSQPGRAALWRIGPALWEGFVGNEAAAREAAAAALALSTDRDVEYGVGLALALAGDSVRAQQLAADLDQRFPEDSSAQSVYVPVIRAVLALKEQKPSEALELLRAAAPYDLGTPLCSAPAYFGILYPVYVRGLAYLAAHQADEATAEFQKILDHRSVVVSDPIGALAHLQLGRALAMKGESARARTSYQEFLTLWKTADPDVALPEQARKELAALR